MIKAVANNGGGGRRGLPRYDTMDKRLCVKVTEAAAMLGISRNFAYQLVNEGKIPSIKFNSRILIPKVALIKMLEEGIPQ